MGTFTKKIQCHETFVTRNPPRTGPTAGATTVGMVSTVAAAPRSFGGKARNSIAVPTGVSMPPPTPCRMRNATRDSTFHARPHRADANVNIVSANMNVFFVPKRSPIHPDAGIQTASDRRYPVTTHSIPVDVTLKSLANCGMATLTIVVSRMSMNNPMTKTIATFHLYGRATIFWNTFMSVRP